MTEEQKIWFDKLVKDRKENAKVLEKPSMRGTKNSIVEKYSDQAHFIYELLQNANDAKATKSSFELTRKGLYFRHNGKVLFNVSNPDTEDQDKKRNMLGHINSITSIAQSNKTDATIGKFGIGFKSVFQYTETPHIYDPNFKFKIERFIVPKLLQDDLDVRQKDETVFYFPFNKPEMPAETAYSDILEKLKRLVFPSLFLPVLQEVKWKTEKNEIGEYSKKIIKKKRVGDIICEKINLKQLVGSEQIKETIYLFTRLTEEHNFNYSVGYFIDEKGKLIPKHYPAFCFFPTKETTNLNFIIHAPFLLNNSRESIMRGEPHNTEMFKLLAQLAADSMLILKDLKLIDDDIIKIIPYKEPDSMSFTHFYTSIKEKFETEEILPAKNKYVNMDNAYWAEDNPVLRLFSDKQLAFLLGKKNANWVFRSLVRNQTQKDKDLREYIENCISDWYDMSDLLKMIDADFIENQSIKWFHNFYEYLLKNNSYWDDVKTKPIFLNEERKAVSAFEQKGKKYYEVLFLPSKNITKAGKIIHSELLKNKKTKEFIEQFGIKEPSLKDEIYNNILPLYDSDGDIDTETHFKIFFTYWIDADKPEEFISLLKDKEFIVYKTAEENKTYRGVASEIYYPTPELLKYFESKPDTKFVDLEHYNSFITNKKDREIMKEFLLKLGVSELPRIIERKIDDWDEKSKIKSYDGESLKYGSFGYSGQGTFDKIVDSCRELLEVIDFKKSLLLWNYLSKLNLSELEGVHKYFYYSQQYQYFESTTLTLLKTTKWLFSKNNELVAPNEVTIQELAADYDFNPELEKLLDFKAKKEFSKAERIASIFESEEEAKEAKKALEEKRKREKRKSERKSKKAQGIDSEDLGVAIESLKNISESVSSSGTELEKINTLTTFNEDEEIAKKVVNMISQLEIKKKQHDLRENINSSIKYSYEWFNSYLQLLNTYSESQDTQKEKTISFQEIKPYKADNKYFLLCGASSYISPEIENAEDFKVSLIFDSGKRENITVEGVSKKGQDLLIYCREPLPKRIISRFSSIFKIEIKFTPVLDLLERLYNAFSNENYIDKWDDIKEAMPASHFIYGPPGTGKTTTLCNRINDELSENPGTKILILTPTNKAADVVCKKLKDINTDIHAVRLSRPTDPDLEEYGIYRDVIDIDEMQMIDVVASTIHRLPYFEIKDSGLLFQYGWDYVIFDEASMAGLHYITFAIMSLFKANPYTSFIVAGDPKQIPPVIEINEKELENFDFQDENIYKMMNLESFNPEEQKVTKREIDTVQNLDTQYRSIPEIGQLFSELSYSNLLKHDRATNKKETKLLPNKIRDIISSNVTFINIPLDENNSIYRVNKLFYSSYHIYSTILVSEIIKYFDTINEEEQWTIGLIAPYRAQATLLNKLITSYGISENIKVISDTVHGFQGDECDIVFFVCNPNNYYYSGHEKALLSKEYIYNVAISRAKDYLIIMHPFIAIKENNYINKIILSYRNNFRNINMLDFYDIEEFIFNEKDYITNNSYVTGHDNVNVFGLTEMKYFIKASDTAIDIQLRDLQKQIATK